MKAQFGFELLEKQVITELQTEASLYRHTGTGAELLSLSNDDANKVFGIVFRTPPRDSTGVAHILEHSVLCGSRKYPIKEPFVELLKGSLQTFLNAFTYPDKTCYPVASQNLTDFYNLIDVYLDAVFHPRITPLIFQQEGWHYEPGDSPGTLTYKGVVYNEMKGAYSSPDSLLHEYSQRSVFPDSIYGLDSGGDPKKIPNLTYEAFHRFHQNYYHPSNARIFFHGDDDPAERLRIVDQYLQEYEQNAPDSAVAPQSPLSEPGLITKSFPAGSGDHAAGKGMLTVNWLLPRTSDLAANIAFTVLEYILLGMPASPLRKTLIESGLGDGIAGIGLENELLQMYFSTGLKGIQVDNAQKVETLILETLTALASDGFDPRTVEAALNTVEFRLRENHSGSFPQGLVLMLRALTTWLYGGNPLEMLAFEKPLTELKDTLRSNPSFFCDLTRKHLVDNPHRATVLLQPDAELAEADNAAEQKKLAEAHDAMTPEQLQEAARTARELQQMQQTPDPPKALAAIPRLKLSEIERKNKRLPLTCTQSDNPRIMFHDLFTSGIFYCDIGLDLHLLPRHLLPYIQLFGRALLETGTKHEDYVSLSQRISCKTGGIQPRLFTSAVKDSARAAAWLFLRGKAMMPKTQDLMAVFSDILLSARFDNRERFKQIVLEEKASQEQKLIPSGHLMVGRRLRAHFHEADWAEDCMNGIGYYLFLKDLAEKIDSQWSTVLGALEEIRQLLVNRSAMIINCTADERALSAHLGLLQDFAATLPGHTAEPASWDMALPDGNEGLLVPSLVNYVGKAADLYAGGYEYHGSIHVISGMLRTSWLWEQVRVQGGAYGAFSSFDRMTGTLALVSYRDPNLLQTLGVFDKTAEYLKGLQLEQSELEKSIIGAIGDIDAHMLPDTKGYVSLQRLLCGNTDEVRQLMRDQILGTTTRHVKDFADILQHFNRNGIVKVLGSEQAISAANKDKSDFLKPLTLI